MKVHINQIKPEGLHLEGEEDAQILELNEPHIQILSPIHYSLDVGLSEGGLFATGTLSVDLELECGSCLEKFSFPLKVNDFALQTELTGAETVDLTPFVREDILLNLPPYPRCDWNDQKECKGVQKKDLKNSEPQIPASGPDVWKELDKLKVKDRK